MPLGSCKDQVLGNRHRPAAHCSVCVITGSNILCGVDLTSNTARTLHDSDQEVVQLELRCEYIDMSSACGTGGTEDFML